MNRVDLIGRWTKDVELRYLVDGKAVAKATLAVDRPWAGEGEQEADFIPVVMWGKTAENVAKHTGKGHLVGIEGRLRVRRYEDREGATRYGTEVIAQRVHFLAKPGNGKLGGAGDPLADFGEGVTPPDEDLPF